MSRRLAAVGQIDAANQPAPVTTRNLVRYGMLGEAEFESGACIENTGRVAHKPILDDLPMPLTARDESVDNYSVGDQAFANASRVSESSSGNTLVRATIGMKFVSPPQRGTTC